MLGWRKDFIGSAGSRILPEHVRGRRTFSAAYRRIRRGWGERKLASAAQGFALDRRGRKRDTSVRRLTGHGGAADRSLACVRSQAQAELLFEE
jgi:hypothetical protein